VGWGGAATATSPRAPWIQPPNLERLSPCRRFQTATQGGWLARTSSTPQHASYGSFTELSERIRRRCAASWSGWPPGARLPPANEEKAAPSTPPAWNTTAEATAAKAARPRARAHRPDPHDGGPGSRSHAAPLGPQAAVRVRGSPTQEQHLDDRQPLRRVGSAPRREYYFRPDRHRRRSRRLRAAPLPLAAALGDAPERRLGRRAHVALESPSRGCT